jgi:hypothetical protein
VFEDALKHFNEAELLHYNRAVLLEQRTVWMKRRRATSDAQS